jgi:xylulokinase
VCTQNCTGAPAEVQAGSGASRDELTHLAGQQAPACAGGLHLLPYFKGERMPMWPQASAALVGVRDGALANGGLLYRAAIEGSTFALQYGIDQYAPCRLRAPLASCMHCARRWSRCAALAWA